MADIRLALISDSLAQTYGRLVFTNDGPLIRGSGNSNLICSGCGYIIGEGFDVPPPMVNAATQCHQCKSYVNLHKESLYLKSPPLLKHITKNITSEIPFAVAGMWQYLPIADALNKLSVEILSPWRQHHATVPGRLFHYTTGSGLVGILSEGQMWASDLAYLNDASELQYALDLIDDVKKEVGKDASAEASELLRRSAISETPHSPEVCYHVACFCADGDQLSQWRAYGGSSDGYAIGFSTEHFVQSGLRLRRVLYDPDKQKSLVKSVFQGAIGQFEKMRNGMSVAELDKEKILPAFSQFLYFHMREFIYSFKHQSFHEEVEWRLVLDVHRHEHLGIINFRQSQGRHIPYVHFSLNIDRKENPTLPIVSITIGPNSTPALAKKSLHLMIERYGYEHVEVLGTDTPLRM